MSATPLPPQTTRSNIKRCCPDCGSPLLKRSSECKHVLLSTTYLVCRNVVCGATFVGVDEITHRLSPPSIPNAEIDLPYAPRAIRSGVLEALGLPGKPEQPASSPPPSRDQEPSHD